MNLISQEEGHRLLDAAIAHAGGVRAYAAKLGVSPQFVSQCRRGYITGRVAEDVGLQSVNAYNFTSPPQDERQERYTNHRRQWRERFENITDKNGRLL